MAARNGDLAQLRAVLASCRPDLGPVGVDVDAGSSEGWTALHQAALKGHVVCLEALLAAGASVHSLTNCGSTPLYCASRNGHAACVRALIAAGSDVHRANQTHGSTPFTGALNFGHRGVLKTLLRAGANVHTGNANRNKTNADAWLFVDAIQIVGGWPQYVHLRRKTLIAKMARWNKLPDAINLKIAAFLEPPGGYEGVDFLPCETLKSTSSTRRNRNNRVRSVETRRSTATASRPTPD